jgi:predicted nucleotidyltransferase
MKRFIALLDIQESGLIDHIVESMDPSTVALYGSYSRGDQDERSDIDILVIGLVRKRPDVMQFGSVLNAEVNVQVFTPARWMKLKKAQDPFYRAVVRDHVILAGGALP